MREPARRLDLPAEPRSLARLVDGRWEFARLVAALMRVHLERDYDAVRTMTRGAGARS